MRKDGCVKTMPKKEKKMKYYLCLIQLQLHVVHKKKFLLLPSDAIMKKYFDSNSSFSFLFLRKVCVKKKKKRKTKEFKLSVEMNFFEHKQSYV